MKEKTCAVCKKRKPLILFITPDGMGTSGTCHYCRTLPARPRRCGTCQGFKSFKEYGSKHAEDCKSCVKQRRDELKLAADKKRRESPACVMWGYAKSRAKQLGLSFSISVDDILIPARCPIRGVKLTIPTGTVTDNTMSLDRVKPELGYVPGNVRVVSMRANQQKTDLDAHTAQKIVDYINEKKA